MAEARDEPAKSHDRSGKPGEFQRFEDLARKLTQIPKTELDEKLKAAKRARSAPRK